MKKLTLSLLCLLSLTVLQAQPLPSLRYLGSFRLPVMGADHFGAGGALVRDRVSNRLAMATRTGRIVLLQPPPLGQGAINTLPIAASDAVLSSAPSFPSGAGFFGALLDNDLVRVTTASIYYDANNTQRVGHYVNGSWRTVRDDHLQGHVAGYMAWVPDRWRNELGDFLTGQAAIPIITRTSHGPSAFSVDLEDFGGTGTVAAWSLVNYPDSGRALADYNGQSLLFNQTTRIAGMAIIGDELIFAGSTGLTGFCYGIGTRTDALHNTTTAAGERYCFDPEMPPDKGGHATAYRFQLWRYRIQDLLAATNSWDVIPVVEELPRVIPGQTRLIGVASIGNVLYVSQYSAETNLRVATYPVVHAFEVNVPPPTTTEPPQPTLAEQVQALTARIGVLEAVIAALRSALGIR